MNWDVVQWATGIFFSLAGAGWIIIELKRKSDEMIIELKDEKTRDIVSDLQGLTIKLDNLQHAQKDQVLVDIILQKIIDFKKGKEKEITIDFVNKTVLNEIKKKLNIQMDKGSKLDLKDFEYIIRQNKN